eukprot:TRINITY_DN19560_c0_g1_i1.p1 TRINITY_DN19560_c0_g1~~TRINITY_DN19560_c0_g1_i1.p1  ORF type:complete len:599 (+),score=161.50 TRINITY_DN19560_c0_g1_i1:114-1910(+)
MAMLSWRRRRASSPAAASSSPLSWILGALMLGLAATERSSLIEECRSAAHATNTSSDEAVSLLVLCVNALRQAADETHTARKLSQGANAAYAADVRGAKQVLRKLQVEHVAREEHFNTFRSGEKEDMYGLLRRLDKVQDAKQLGEANADDDQGEKAQGSKQSNASEAASAGKEGQQEKMTLNFTAAAGEHGSKQAALPAKEESTPNKDARADVVAASDHAGRQSKATAAADAAARRAAPNASAESPQKSTTPTGSGKAADAIPTATAALQTGAVRKATAQEAATAGLPGHWQTALDASSGRRYYYNRETGISQWQAPVAAEAETLPGDWRVAVDAHTGRRYYYNLVSRQSSWEKPSFSSAINVSAKNNISAKSNISGVSGGPSHSTGAKERGDGTAANEAKKASRRAAPKMPRRLASAAAPLLPAKEDGAALLARDTDVSTLELQRAEEDAEAEVRELEEEPEQPGDGAAFVERETASLGTPTPLTPSVMRPCQHARSGAKGGAGGELSGNDLDFAGTGDVLAGPPCAEDKNILSNDLEAIPEVALRDPGSLAESSEDQSFQVVEPLALPSGKSSFLEGDAAADDQQAEADEALDPGS